MTPLPLDKLGPKIGPLPAGVWVVVVVAGVYVGKRRKQAAADAAAAAPVVESVGAQSSDGYATTGDGYGLDSTGMPYTGADYGNVPTAGGPMPAPISITVNVPKQPVYAPPRVPVPAPAPRPAPRPATPPVVTSPATYTIRSGDTLAAIAVRFHTTASRLLQLNAATLDAAARQHGHANSSSGRYIFPGTVIRLR